MKKFNLMSLLVILLTFGLNFNIMAQDLLITGIADGPLTGGKPKVLELYVVNDIADLSAYTVQNQTNANTEWGNPLSLSGSANAGDFIYITTSATEFNSFFENTIVPIENNVVNFNGDDRVAIFNGDNMVDLFGEDGVDGTGTAWEYSDGWAYRNAGSTPSATFNVADWTFSGIDQLEGGETNATCTAPFPIGTYTASSPVSSFPEDFEDGLTLPEGWHVINGGDAAQTWIVHNDIWEGAHSGSQAAAIKFSSEAHDDYLVLPAIDVVANTTDQVTFWVKHRSSYIETYDVRLSTTVNDNADAFSVVLQPEQASINTWEQQEINLAAYVGQTVYVAIRATATDKFCLYVDDVDVSGLPSCPNPMAFTATNIESTQATLTWTAGASETAWNIIYSPQGFDPATAGTTVNATETTLILTDLTPDTSYDVYVQADCGAGDLSELTAVKTTFRTLVSCPAPTAFTATNIEATQATLTWTAGASETEWNVIYGPQGFDPATAGTTVTVTEATVTLTGLSIATTYDAYVQAKCSADDLSAITTDVKTTFATACSVFTPEYTQDFTSFLPNCWTRARGNIGEALVGSDSYWGAGGFANNGFTGAATINLYGNSRKEWLISPEFDLSAGGYELNYDIAVTKYYGTLASEMGSDDEVQVLYTEDGGTTWNNLKTYNASNTPSNTGVSEIIELSAITGNLVQFAFWATDGSVDDEEDYKVYIDNFVVRTIPTCPEPTDVTVSNITATTADIAWVSTATEWNIKVSTTAIDPATADGDVLANQATTDNPYNLTNLTAGTTYYVYVQANCGAGDLSEWTNEYTFNTSDVFVELPIINDFEVGLGSIILRNGTQTNHWMTGALDSQTGNALYVTNDDSANQYTTNSTSTSHAYIPVNFNGATSVNLSFNWICNGEKSDYGTDYDYLKVYLIPDSIAINAGVLLSNDYRIGEVYNQQTTLQNASIELSATEITQDLMKLVFTWKNDGSGGDNPPASIDNISLTAITCPKPTEVVASNITATTADIAWVSTAAEWNIKVSTTAIDPATADGDVLANEATTTNPHALTNLTAGTTYYVYVQANCGAGELSEWSTEYTFETLPCSDIQDVMASNITTTTATIAWTENSIATEWTLKVASSSINPVTDAGDIFDATVSTNPTQDLTNLTSGTTYYVYVKANCGGDWTTEYTFKTLCDVITSFPFTETFEDDSQTRDCWSQEYVSGTRDWTFGAGDGSIITSAYEGELNARFTSVTHNGDKTKLITPVLDLSDGSDYQLKFHYAQAAWGADQNTLAVFYRIDATTEWIQLSEYTEEAADWTEVILSLPNPSATYQIAFEGTDNYGRKVIVDNVIVGVATAPANIDLAIIKPTGKVSCSLTAAETIEVEVKNAGAELVTSGTVFTFTLVSAGNTLLTEDLTIDTDLNQNDTWSGTTTGTIDLSAIGTTEFTASITQANDNVADNNSIEGSFIHFEQSLEFVGAVNDTITINSAYPYTIEANVTINPTGITETTEYLWSDGSTGETLTVNSDGLYTLTITTADCETEKSVYVHLFSGINELTANDVSVYPNPSSGEFTIDMTLVEKQDIVISIINTNGQVVREVKFDNIDTLLERFNLNDVSEGLYNVRIATNKGVINRQVVIQ